MSCVSGWRIGTVRGPEFGSISEFYNGWPSILWTACGGGAIEQLRGPEGADAERIVRRVERTAEYACH